MDCILRIGYMELSHLFLHVGARSRKLKVISMIFGWARPFHSQDLKICCILRMSL